MDDNGPSYLSESDPGIDRRRRRAALISVLVACGLIAVAIVVAGASYRRCQDPPGVDGRTVTFVVHEGATGQQVVADLASQGLIRCGGFMGNLLLRGTGQATAILAGSYDIPVGSSLAQILSLMTTPPEAVPTVRVTIPEGLRIRSTFPGERSISSVVEEQTGVAAKEFARLAESGRFDLRPYLAQGRGAEGYLFPNTFQFVKKGIGAKEMIRTMLDEFRTQAEELDLLAGAKKLGLTPYELVTLASMIEREAQVDDERALIAGVIFNRLGIGQSLGIDATLLYDDPSPDGELSTADLQTDTPYNTRINAGLPPSPIASPGRASLDAALHPEQTEYLYYVLCPRDGEGVHRFATTYEEHLVNVRECLGG
ncbi:MAG TPA: endolytic transglycosylase MltG [Actinomycetota bacterium]|nr:endolytic transglycosylase MltG [Actinomycetota bacterium]